MTLREEIAKYQMELYCFSKGWEVDDWYDLPDEVHEKYRSEADQILAKVKEHLEKVEKPVAYYPDDGIAFSAYRNGYQAQLEAIIKSLEE